MAWLLPILLSKINELTREIDELEQSFYAGDYATDTDWYHKEVGAKLKAQHRLIDLYEKRKERGSQSSQ